MRDDGRGGPVVPGHGLRGASERLSEFGGTVVVHASRQWIGAPGPSPVAPDRGAFGIIRLAIPEDQMLVRDALAKLLVRVADFIVVGEAADGAEAIALVERRRPDVVRMDIEMLHLDGLEACRRIAARHPAVRVAILTTFGRPGYLQQALEAGAAALRLKDDPVDRLAGNIRRIAAGEQVIDPSLAVLALATGPCSLTPRELEVLRAAADGSPVAEVARRLNLREGSVRNYLSVVIQNSG